MAIERLPAEGHFTEASSRGTVFFKIKLSGKVRAVLLLWWLVGALLACEEHLDITVGFGLKTDSEGCLLCWF